MVSEEKLKLSHKELGEAYQNLEKETMNSR
jgi:hypothetical protein